MTKTSDLVVTKDLRLMNAERDKIAYSERSAKAPSTPELTDTCEVQVANVLLTDDVAQIS